MAIRKRISQGAELLPFDEPADNVINERANDERGVVDPSSDILGTSYIEAMIPDGTPEQFRDVIGAISHDVAQHGQQHHPNDLHVKNLLANTRVMFQPGFNVERTYRNRIRSPLTGIRAFCVVVCHSGSPKSVAGCHNLSCPLWAFRMGKNGLR